MATVLYRLRRPMHSLDFVGIGLQTQPEMSQEALDLRAALWPAEPDLAGHDDLPPIEEAA